MNQVQPVHTRNLSSALSTIGPRLRFPAFLCVLLAHAACAEEPSPRQAPVLVDGKLPGKNNFFVGWSGTWGTRCTPTECAETGSGWIGRGGGSIDAGRALSSGRKTTELGSLPVRLITQDSGTASDGGSGITVTATATLSYGDHSDSETITCNATLGEPSIPQLISLAIPEGNIELVVDCTVE